MAPTPLGRAGFDVAHVVHGKDGNRANRARLLEEEARSLDSAWAAKQAARNGNVDPKRTAENRVFVNDGGGLRLATSAADVVAALDYGDARVKRVKRKIGADQLTTTMLDIHLPKSMCEERTWVGPDGRTRRYWGAKDPAEAERFFDEARALVVAKVGADAIHSEVRHYDEHTPHAQWVVDTFGNDPKSKDPIKDLRQMYSQTWGSHREVKDERGVQISGPRKMSEWQAATRSHMIAAGFPIEADVDPIRSKRKHAKADYIELAKREEKMDARAIKAAQVEGEIHAYRDRVTAWAGGVKEKIKEAHQDAARDRESAARDREKAEVERQAAEAERHRLSAAPPEFERFLDRPRRDGQTLRPLFEKETANSQRIRARFAAQAAEVAEAEQREAEADDGVQLGGGSSRPRPSMASPSIARPSPRNAPRPAAPIISTSSRSMANRVERGKGDR